jgi:hypothetical protein
MVTQEDLEERVEFPWSMTFSKDALKRAVSETLGGVGVHEVKLFPSLGVQSWKHGASVIVHYVLANGTNGSAKFVIFVLPEEEGITVHFEAQTIPQETSS